MKAVPFREGVVIQKTLAFHPLDGFIDFARVVLSALHWTRKSYSLSRCSGKRRTTPSPAFWTVSIPSFLTAGPASASTPALYDEVNHARIRVWAIAQQLQRLVIVGNERMRWHHHNPLFHYVGFNLCHRILQYGSDHSHNPHSQSWFGFGLYVTRRRNHNREPFLHALRRQGREPGRCCS